MEFSVFLPTKMKEPKEPKEPRKKMYQSEIAQMMYVFGEVQDPLDQTTALVEQIIRSQITLLISNSIQQSQKRNSRFLCAEDLIFLIRHDKEKVNRLRSFLSWKDVRKNVKVEKGGIEEDLDDELEKSKVKKMSVKFSWDFLNGYTSVLEENDDEIDEDDEEAFETQTQRLKMQDNITRVMSQDEYIYYSECRQASFTYKKLKKFKEWTELSKMYDSKANSDIIDSLGFLCCEAVSKLTELSLKVKQREEERNLLKPKQGVVFRGLFQKPVGNQRPLQPRHIQEAFRLLQQQSFAMQKFGNSIKRRDLCLF